MTNEAQGKERGKIDRPGREKIQAELSSAQSIDAFWGREGICARLFSKTLEQLLEGELRAVRGYEKDEGAGRQSGNRRNGKYKGHVRTSGGKREIAVPRDRHGEVEPKILHQYETSSNELADKIVTLDAKGLSPGAIGARLQELDGVEVSAATISAVTDKGWSLVEAGPNGRLAPLYASVDLDAIDVHRRRAGRIEPSADYSVLGVDREGRQDALGQWVGDGVDGVTFWTSLLGELQARGVKDILIACMDGLTGCPDAVPAVFPNPVVQRCSVHPIRTRLKSVVDLDQVACLPDLKVLYQAPSRDQAETPLLNLSETWPENILLPSSPGRPTAPSGPRSLPSHPKFGGASTPTTAFNRTPAPCEK